MNNTEFKSGDKVVFCKSSLESGMIDAKEGDVFTVQECHGPGCRVISLKELSGYYHKTHFEHYVEKEKVMEKYIPNVGDEVKGFKFYGYCYPDIGYAESMNDVIGEQGTVFSVSEDRFVIDFGDSRWTYPLDLAHLAKVEEPYKFEEPPKEVSHEDTQTYWEGSQIDWQIGQVVWDVVYGKGEVVNILQNVLRYPVVVKFVDGKRHFTEDGKTDEEFARTLFFSEPKIIAETKPPKKPFLPTLKEGDKVVIQTTDYDFIAIIVSEDEEEIFIKRQVSGIRYPKNCIKVYKLGEQVKFS